MGKGRGVLRRGERGLVSLDFINSPRGSAPGGGGFWVTFGVQGKQEKILYH